MITSCVPGGLGDSSANKRYGLWIAKSIACHSMLAILCLVPVLQIFAIAFSSKLEVMSVHVGLYPKGFTLENYRVIMQDMQFFRSCEVKILRAIIGWAISIVLVVLAAYPLRQRESSFPARKYIVVYFMLAMIFNSGMIPT